jgi:hemolysin activation/secretion protein
VTDRHDDSRLPFYLMPSLGGNSSVRGYPSLRFRGNHRLLLTGEYRWTATRFLDMALFYDAGKVATEIDELDLGGLKYAYGVGARFHGTKRTVFRLEVARNDAGGWRMVWATTAPF